MICPKDFRFPLSFNICKRWGDRNGMKGDKKGLFVILKAMKTGGRRQQRETGLSRPG